MKYILSFDIEADNKTPTVGSMRQLGIFTEDENGDEKTFCVNIQRQEGEGISENPDTVKWLKEQGVYERLDEGAVTPAEAMQLLSDWLKDLRDSGDGKNKFHWVAKPAAFDWMWLASYYHRYGPADKIDIGFKATCIASKRDAFFEVYFASMGGDGFDPSSKKWELEKRMMEGPLNHDALDDARKQYRLYQKINVLLPLIGSGKYDKMTF